MVVLQLIGVGFLIASLSCRCDGKHYSIKSRNVEFTLFGPQMGSLEAAVEVAGRGTPYDDVSFLSTLRLANETEPNWLHELEKASGDISFLIHDIQNIEKKFIDILKKFKQLYNNREWNIEPTVIVHILKKVIKGDSLFRLYPSLSLPTLLALTKFTLVINEKVPDTDTFCYLRHAYDIYFEPTYLERVRHVDINADFPHYPAINRNALLWNELKRNPSENVVEIRCKEESGQYDEKKAKLKMRRCSSDDSPKDNWDAFSRYFKAVSNFF